MSVWRKTYLRAEVMDGDGFGVINRDRLDTCECDVLGYDKSESKQVIVAY